MAAVSQLPRGVRVVLVGDLGALRSAAQTIGSRLTLVPVQSAQDAWRVAPPRVAVWQPTEDLRPSDRRPGRPGRAAGAAQLAWVDSAADAVALGMADALVTGPVNKDAVARSRSPGSEGFLGHTEHLARRLGALDVTMAFHSRALSLTTSLVTTHVPLADVAPLVNRRGVARATYATARFVCDISPEREHRVAVASLNPHAGEGGLLGSEERQAIVPGIASARRRLSGGRVQVVGPVPAETAFRLAAAGEFSAVVAMYHDQATIPMKLLSFGDAVNVTLGLPIVRTSVDHGTAYDRAGKGTAYAAGMIEAIALAARLALAAQLALAAHVPRVSA